MNGNSNDRKKLKTACEISADRVVAARASEAGSFIEACTARNLPAGSVTPGLSNANIGDRSAVVSALSDVLSAVGGRQRDIVVVIPDAACRIALLDFDDLPEKPQEADSVVRFRLKKSLPFDVDRARLSFDVRRSGSTVRVTAVVALPSVIEEYEAVVRDAGFSPGVVMPSTVAALAAVNTSNPVLVAKITSDAVSLAIAHESDLLLFRTIELAGGTIDGEQLAEDAYPSLVFFQDTYGLKVQRALIGGAVTLDGIGPVMEKQTGLRVEELVDSTLAGPAAAGQRAFMGGVVGALIS
jgi:type IV pilus assembly protein PilM